MRQVAAAQVRGRVPAARGVHLRPLLLRSRPDGLGRQGAPKRSFHQTPSDLTSTSCHRHRLVIVCLPASYTSGHSDSAAGLTASLLKICPSISPNPGECENKFELGVTGSAFSTAACSTKQICLPSTSIAVQTLSWHQTSQQDMCPHPTTGMCMRSTPPPADTKCMAVCLPGFCLPQVCLCICRAFHHIGARAIHVLGCAGGRQQ